MARKKEGFEWERITRKKQVEKARRGPADPGPHRSSNPGPMSGNERLRQALERFNPVQTHTGLVVSLRIEKAGVNRLSLPSSPMFLELCDIIHPGLAKGIQDLASKNKNDIEFGQVKTPNNKDGVTVRVEKIPGAAKNFRIVIGLSPEQFFTVAAKIGFDPSGKLDVQKQYKAQWEQLKRRYWPAGPETTEKGMS